VWLEGAGYKTAHVGKYLNGYESAVGDPRPVAPGWNVWYTTTGTTRYYDYDVSANGRLIHFGDHDNDYVSRVISRKAKTLVQRFVPRRKPLYLQVDHRAPHTETGIESRGGCSGRTVPDPDDKQLYKGDPLPQPPSFNEADVSDKPSFMRTRAPLPPERLKKLTKRYTCALASLKAVDRGVEKIVKALKKAGELRKTVIAFTSDNGYYHGEHRIGVGKIYPYEEGIHVPLVMRVPEQYRGGGQRVSEVSEPVGNIDLAPTFLELAGGAKPCRGDGACRVMDGRSLLGLLGGREGSYPDDRALVTEYSVGSNLSQEDGLCSYSGVRTADAIYVEHIVANSFTEGCKETPERELYNLGEDPFELRSLDGGVAPQLESTLSDRLDALRDCAGIAGRDPRVEGRPYCE
jgi:arylsulfatase A-like enzyme